MNNLTMSTSIIKNFDELVTTPLRRDALSILKTGYEAVETARVIREEVQIRENDICIKGQNICLTDYNRVFFVGIGKCAVDAAVVFEEILGERISDGIVLDVKSGEFRYLRSLVGDHPFPTEKNVKHTEEIVKMLLGVTEKDLVITIISGGGSSLLCLPHDVKCEVLTDMTAALWARGATIREVNTVRKHLSNIQGGRLAKLAYPATVLSFVFSDVPGNDLSIIASGPTVMDSTTDRDAAKILSRYDVLTQCKLTDCNLTETPKSSKYFSRVMNILLVTNDRALTAMKSAAEVLGYNTQIKSNALQGNAATLGKEIGAIQLSPRTCHLYGGETTVEIKSSGKGGRNQEFALAAACVIPHQQVLIAAASDGWDNSDIAGAICDAGDRERAARKNLNIEQFLQTNNSYHFWESVGGKIITGRTGINVADFYLKISE